jgi:hypothetical protein
VGVPRSTQAPLVAGGKGPTSSETEKVELPDLPRSDLSVTAVSPEMLQRDEAIVPEDVRRTRAPSVAPQRKRKSHYSRSWILEDERKMDLTIKPREKPFISSCLHVLKLRERPYARLL